MPRPITPSAGSFVHIPGGTVHAFRVNSDTARYLIITTPRHLKTVNRGAAVMICGCAALIARRP